MISKIKREMGKGNDNVILTSDKYGVRVLT